MGSAHGRAVRRDRRRRPVRGGHGRHAAGARRSAGPARRPGRVPQRHRLHPPAVPRLAGPARPARGRRAAPRGRTGFGRSSTAGGCSGTPWPAGSPRSAGTTAPAPSGGWRWTSAMVETAAAAGAETRFGTTVDRLIGSGTADDPVRGVVLEHRRAAPRALGHRRRRSHLDRRPAAGPADEPAAAGARCRCCSPTGRACPTRSGATSTSTATSPDVRALRGRRAPAVRRRPAGPDPRIGRRSGAEAYLAALRRFPAVLNPRLLDQARQVSPVVVVPETMLRGFARPATGPGWALVGDAGPLQAPGDRAGHRRRARAGLVRRQRPGPRRRPRTTTRSGATTAPPATTSGPSRPPASPRRTARPSTPGSPPTRWPGREFLDTFARRHRPDEVLTPARRARWRAAWAYEEGLDELRGLLEGLDDAAMATRGARPARHWSVGDLLAHLVGVAEDAVARWLLRRRHGGLARSRPSPRRGTRGPTSTCGGRPTGPATRCCAASTCTAAGWSSPCAAATVHSTAGPAWMVAGAGRRPRRAPRRPPRGAGGSR